MKCTFCGKDAQKYVAHMKVVLEALDTALDSPLRPIHYREERKPACEDCLNRILQSHLGTDANFTTEPKNAA